MRTAAAAPLPAMPPSLPPGFERRPTEAHRDARPPHRPTPMVTPLSGVLSTVTGTTGQDIHIHRADYTRPTPHGGFTLHGYAWRCPSCSTLSRGYEPREFAHCRRDARGHACGGDGRG